MNSGCSDSLFLKQIIMGNPGSKLYDGVHLRGSEASRHFTYRAVQAIKPAVTNESVSGHTNCPQARYQRQSLRNNS